MVLSRGQKYHLAGGGKGENWPGLHARESTKMAFEGEGKSCSGARGRKIRTSMVEKRGPGFVST